jgi:hypothetical protein
MNAFKKYYLLITAIIITLIPVVVLLTELYIHKRIISRSTTSLVLTNFTGLLPALQSLYYTLTNQKYMILEFVLFYGIVFTSGSYHFCSKINYKGQFCNSFPEITYSRLDFINSYFCIIATILYIAKFEFALQENARRVMKTMIYVIELTIVFMSIVKFTDVFMPMYFTCLSFVPVLLLVINNRKQYIEKYLNCYKIFIFIMGLICGTIAFITYVSITFKHYEKEEDYWIYHSFGWHIPVMLCPLFLFEATTAVTHKSFFCYVGEFFHIIKKQQSYSQILRDRGNTIDIMTDPIETIDL